MAVTAAVALTVSAAAYFFFNNRRKNSNKKQIVFVLGGPGSGKGTNCTKIVNEFGYVHLSAGDLLREEKTSGSELAQLIEDHIKKGSIVPAEITVRLLQQAMERAGTNKFLIDGFPRDLGNLKLWEEKMDNECHVQFLLFLDCPEDEMTTRLLKRGETSGRVDDNIEAIKKRFKTYRESTMPIIEYYRKLGKTREVNSNRDEESVYRDIQTYFQSSLARY